MKRTYLTMLVLVPVFVALSGCSDDLTQRDVYTRFEDCVADWGKPELCQKIAETEAKQFADAHGVASGSGGSDIIFWGPSYYPHDRAVVYNDQTYAPKISRAMSVPFMVKSTSSVAARSSPASARISRGGFGGTARSVFGGGIGG